MIVKPKTKKMDTKQASVEATHAEQIATVQRDLTSFGIRFDRHLEIYAQNGKELAALNVTVTGLKEQMNGFASSISALDINLSGIDDKMDKKFVTNDRFWPVKTLVYGTVGILLLGTLSTLGLWIVTSRTQATSQSNSEAAQAAAQAAIEQLKSQYTIQVKP